MTLLPEFSERAPHIYRAQLFYPVIFGPHDVFSMASFLIMLIKKMKFTIIFSDNVP
jgi:hypothetical protein